MLVQTCLPRATLKEYLSGWTDEEQTEQIEQHLAECFTCEQTVTALESDPDTLLESLRDPKPSIVQETPDLSEAAEFKSAILQAQQLMDPASQSQTPMEKFRMGDVGAYELVELIGRGGMGAVYLARHKQLGKQVAIKVLPAPSAMDADVRTRFLREIQAAGRVNHPSVVTATDAGEFQGTHYLVMEYIVGLDLSRLARHVGPLPIADACEIIRQAALGLSHAHSEGIVHRDIKPSNLMLDESGCVKILDFGLAQLDRWDESSADLTTVGQLMGTLDYMAPEQADRCGAVDYRADLYALGATLFRLLCGRAPLAATPKQSPLEKLRLLANHQPPRLDTLRPDAPEQLVKLVATMLARHPEDRPASAAHVAEQLQSFAKGHDLSELLASAHTSARANSNPMPKDLLTNNLLPSTQYSGERGSGVRGFDLGSRQLVADDVASNFARSIAISHNDRGRNNRRRWSLATAAMLPLMILGGILITLEMQKGQLVIESEVDVQVLVKTLRDGKPVGELQIKPSADSPGTNSMKLYADKYEITVTPSDGISIDKNQVTLTRGGISVARITHGSMSVAVAPSTSAATNPLSTSSPRISEEVNANSGTPPEPLFDGKTLSEWLETLERDRSPNATGTAFNALEALTAPQTAQQITSALLRIAPTRDGLQEIPTRNGNSTTFFDSRAFELFAKANPGDAYSRFIVDQIRTPNEAWRFRIMNYAVLTNSRGVNPFELDSALKIFVEGIGKQFLDSADSKTEDWTKKVVEVLYRFAVATQGVPLDIRDLSIDYLRRFHGSNNRVALHPVFDPRWPAPFQSEVVRRAAKALADENLPVEDVCFASIHLKADEQGVMIPSSDLKPIVVSRLRKLATDPNRLLQLVESPSSIYMRNYRSLPVSKLVVVDNYNVGREYEYSEAIELLEISKRFKDDSTVIDVLNEVLKATQSQHEKVDAQIRNYFESQGRRGRGAGGGRASGQESLARGGQGGRRGAQGSGEGGRRGAQGSGEGGRRGAQGSGEGGPRGGSGGGASRAGGSGGGRGLVYYDGNKLHSQWPSLGIPTQPRPIDAQTRLDNTAYFIHETVLALLAEKSDAVSTSKAEVGDGGIAKP